MLLLCIALLAGPSPILIRIIYLCTIFPFPTENYHSLRPCETAAEQQQHQPPVGNAIERNKILDKVIDKMEIGSERDKCYMKTSIHTNNGFSVYFVQYVRGIWWRWRLSWTDPSVYVYCVFVKSISYTINVVYYKPESLANKKADREIAEHDIHNPI